ncbi:hypothetical protein NDN08_002135 [Rhodosorus marinus]|uniref:Uncharacterized protein n=1 Tax=Rhodosorus marinus TaxID=101924 RepID=A0AAV8USW2_9RHOD|nr:hypothetical protein NDN08_002135 [Rhodosorus marinus]
MLCIDDETIVNLAKTNLKKFRIQMDYYARSECPRTSPLEKSPTEPNSSNKLYEVYYKDMKTQGVLVYAKVTHRADLENFRIRISFQFDPDLLGLRVKPVKVEVIGGIANQQWMKNNIPSFPARMDAVNSAMAADLKAVLLHQFSEDALQKLITDTINTFVLKRLTKTFTTHTVSLGIDFSKLPGTNIAKKWVRQNVKVKSVYKENDQLCVRVRYPTRVTGNTVKIRSFAFPAGHTVVNKCPYALAFLARLYVTRPVEIEAVIDYKDGYEQPFPFGTILSKPGFYDRTFARHINGLSFYKTSTFARLVLTCEGIFGWKFVVKPPGPGVHFTASCGITFVPPPNLRVQLQP